MESYDCLRASAFFLPLHAFRCIVKCSRQDIHRHLSSTLSEWNSPRVCNVNVHSNYGRRRKDFPQERSLCFSSSHQAIDTRKHTHMLFKRQTFKRTILFMEKVLRAIFAFLSNFDIWVVCGYCSLNLGIKRTVWGEFSYLCPR